MIRNNRFVLVLVLCMCLLCSCKVKRPDGVLSSRAMEKVMYDYHLAQAISDQLPADEKYKSQAIMDWVYEKHGVNRDDFELSLKWYTRYPKEFAKIYNKLYARIEYELKRSSMELLRIEHRVFGIMPGDSVSLWYLDSLAIMNSSAYMNRITLDLDCDSTFHNGDTLAWTSCLTLVSPADSIEPKVYVALAASYGDSVVAVDRLLSGRGSYDLDLRLVMDDSLKMSSLRFQASYIDDSREGMAILSGLDMVRYHRK